jgi:hypothetical protein
VRGGTVEVHGQTSLACDGTAYLVGRPDRRGHGFGVRHDGTDVEHSQPWVHSRVDREVYDRGRHCQSSHGDDEFRRRTGGGVHAAVMRCVRVNIQDQRRRLDRISERAHSVCIAALRYVGDS